MPVILEGADFLTGAAAVLTGLLTDACLDAVAELELVDTGEAVALEAVGFPTVPIERAGFALTNTGSVDGIGLPSLVWSFTTCDFTKGNKTIKICWYAKAFVHMFVRFDSWTDFLKMCQKKIGKSGNLLVFGATDMCSIGVHPGAGNVTQLTA